MPAVTDGLGNAARRYRTVNRALVAVQGSMRGPASKQSVAEARGAMRPVLAEVPRLDVGDEMALEGEMEDVADLFGSVRAPARRFDEHVCRVIEVDVRAACERWGFAVGTHVWGAVYLAALVAVFGDAFGEVDGQAMRRPWQAMNADRRRRGKAPA